MKVQFKGRKVSASRFCISKTIAEKHLEEEDVMVKHVN